MTDGGKSIEKGRVRDVENRGGEREGGEERRVWGGGGRGGRRNEG